MSFETHSLEKRVLNVLELNIISYPGFQVYEMTGYHNFVFSLILEVRIIIKFQILTLPFD